MEQASGSTTIGATTPRLLSLPPEIRNMIYRLVVVQGVINIPASTTSPEPPLLRANKKIRQEAMQIYCKENVFRWRIRVFDARHYIAW
jgi:hypothetical protein